MLRWWRTILLATTNPSLHRLQLFGLPSDIPLTSRQTFRISSANYWNFLQPGRSVARTWSPILKGRINFTLCPLSSLLPLLLPSPFYTHFPPVLPIHSPGAECGQSTFFQHEREDHVTCWANIASRQQKLTSPANIECGLPVQNIHPTVFISNNFSFILSPGSYCYGLIERNKKLYKYLTNTPSQG